MKNNIKKITVLFVFMSLFGCSDFLEQEPYGLVTPQNFWISQVNAESALAGDYALLKRALLDKSCFLIWGEFPGVTFMNSNQWIMNYIEDNGNYVLPYIPQSRDWKALYRSANWSLAIEDHVSKMPDGLFKSKAEKNRIMGEAAFVRSLSYFYLARIWGEVPIVEDVYESLSQVIDENGFVKAKPRDSEAKVLDYALAAADKAISLLEYSNPSDPNWAIMANKGSAEALKAHITLWYASRNGNNAQMLNQCVAAASSVIANSNAELIDYTDNLDYDPDTDKYTNADFERMCKGQSKTGLFEINIDAGMNESYRLDAADTPQSYTLTEPYLSYSNTSGIAISDDFYGKDMMNSDSDRDDDVRKKLFFSDFDSDEINSLMKYTSSVKDTQSGDAYAQFAESNILIFRLADVYLLRAEAYMKLGNFAAAVSDLNMIRSKANVPDYHGDLNRESLTKAIFDERAIEFVGEGQAAFDRIRMDYFDYDHNSMYQKSRIAKKGYFWPVNPPIIANNPAIVQTLYWQGQNIRID